MSLRLSLGQKLFGGAGENDIDSSFNNEVW
jgi:hypothetical protein